jgi:hypothetical protein
VHKLAEGGEVVKVKFHILETWELNAVGWSAALFSEPSAPSVFSALTQKIPETILSVKVITRI